MSYNNLEEYLVPASYFSQGGLWLWGRNSYGQLGDTTRTDVSSPIQTIAGGTNWKLISSGFYHTAAIKTNGTLWLWGQNTYGNLADNTTTNKSSPVQTVAGGTNWKQVSVGRYYINAAIKTDGTLWTWGNGLSGSLGDGTSSGKSSPIQTIAAGTNWKSVATGPAFVGAIKTDGTLWTWGDNLYGNLGDNTIANKSSPVQTVAGGTNWKSVSVSMVHTVAIKTDGTLWTWGYNNIGQLGDNTIVMKSSPIQTVAGGTNWKLVASAFYITAAIKTDGTLWNWGDNRYGQLGNNTTTSKSSPIQTVAGGTNWKLVSTGGYQVISINGTWGTIT
jgi:alpha-tubulin suppressor-like RCC1 family protein